MMRKEGPNVIEPRRFMRETRLRALPDGCARSSRFISGMINTAPWTSSPYMTISKRAR
jgi:hypothetical protein